MKNCVRRNDSKHRDINHSNKNVTRSDPKSDQLVATHTSDRKKINITYTDTTKVNSPQKLLTNREIPAIIPVVVPPVNQMTTDGVVTSGRALYVVRAVLRKEIFKGATCSAAGVLKDPPMVNWKDSSRTVPLDRNTVGMPPITTTPVRNGTVPYVPPIIIGS